MANIARQVYPDPVPKNIPKIREILKRVPMKPAIMTRRFNVWLWDQN